ncbi:tyrosine-type recombinase/integrase [Sphingomonas sp. R-74633]|uniref:tyrosine-type recombinase/integrase n=1 Tax=Sphingomonas sp. R-74633 TaxID=2751188 RepID=UPI0015D1A5D8|nr:tyrosine-type recombinase/integrase [Sphingomonas sp. R-74633]NYT43143.1 tyrosine-type recombinase/integrase [Sphingomonas sp. R-74633]
MSVQFIKSARKGKPVTWYIYAFRGGPLIRKVESPRKPKLTSSDHAAVAAALVDDTAINPSTFRWIIRKCCPVNPAKAETEGSPEWNALADSTKYVWRRHVDAIETKWGKFPPAIWDDPRMIAKVVAWRDTMKNTPRTADIAVQVLVFLLDYARLHAHVKLNVARNVPSLYKGADRAEIIWIPEDFEKFAASAKKDGRNRQALIDGLSLAAVTGLRREDLITLTWDQIGEFAIVKKALKMSRRKRRRVVIPQTPQLEAVLAELRARPRAEGVNTVLVNNHGKPWSLDGFGSGFSQIKREAGIVHVDDEGNERPKHLHDVRGTFCTMLLTEWDCTDEEAADIMGWSPARVGQIRKVYVDQKAVVVALGARIAAKQFAKQAGGDAGT